MYGISEQLEQNMVWGRQGRKLSREILNNLSEETSLPLSASFWNLMRVWSSCHGRPERVPTLEMGSVAEKEKMKRLLSRLCGAMTNIIASSSLDAKGGIMEICDI